MRLMLMLLLRKKQSSSFAAGSSLCSKCVCSLSPLLLFVCHQQKYRDGLEEIFSTYIMSLRSVSSVRTVT